jgi:orotate phosphoribosyltransferase
MLFDSQKFQDFIINNQVIKIAETPFNLKSGQQSNLYVNWRTVSEDVFSLDILADFLLSYIETNKIKADCIFGVPEGATKLAILSSYKLAKQSPNYAKGSHIMAMGRGKPKTHGSPQDSHYLGFPKDKKVVVIEDVTTTGTSLKQSVETLKSSGIDVVAAVILTNRHLEQADLEKSFHDLCPLFSMSKLDDLLARVIETHQNPEWAMDILKNQIKMAA